MYPQTSNNPNSNNPYAYQQMPPNFLNEGEQTYAAAAYQQQQQQQQQMQFGNIPQQYQNPSQQNYAYNPPNNYPQPGLPIPPQQYSQQPIFVPIGPQYFPDPVTTYCNFRVARRNNNRGADPLIEQAIDSLTLNALREIWASLPLSFQSVNGSGKMLSKDYVENSILKPLIQANPSIPTEAIFGGKVLSASRILHEGIKKNFWVSLVATFIFMAIIVMFEIIYTSNYYYYNDGYILTLQIIGLIWMSIQSGILLIGVSFANLQMVKIASILSTFFILYSFVIFICGIIGTTSTYYASDFNIFFEIIGFVFIMGAIVAKTSQSRIKFFMGRIFVLIKQLPENEVNQKICQ